MNTVGQILDTLEDALQAGRSDGQLLDLFVRSRDERAFADVVRRHGPMVLAVCRRVLRNSADADDAFQAAFLVLARKAPSITARHQLAQWLYGVAYNTARKLRQLNGRRVSRECPLDRTPEPHADTSADRADLLAVLDEELHNLPERYRAVVVLCDLEGLTRREAAKALSCPEGTVAGRLARARYMLAARLTARGVGSAGAALAVVLSERTTMAITPAAVLQVGRAGHVDSLASAAGKGFISPRVAATTEEVLKSMFATRLRTAAAVVLCCGLALAGTVGAVHFANAGLQPVHLEPGKAEEPDKKPPTDKPPEPAAKEAEEKILTVFPLKKLDPEATAKVISGAYQDKGVTATALGAERSIMVYANDRITVEIDGLLQKLGEPKLKRASAIRLHAGLKPKPVAELLAKSYPDAAFVPVADDGVLLVYGDHLTAKRIRALFGSALTPKPISAPLERRTFRFEFKDAAWPDVLDAYSTLSGLALLTMVTPNGKFSFTPPSGKELTLNEITDVINDALAAKKFILIRRRMSFFIHPMDERIEPSAIPRIEFDELTKRGQTELVEVMVGLRTIDAEKAMAEVQKLLTPLGTISIASGNRLVILDRAGNIRRVLDVLETADKPAPPKTYPMRFEKVPWADLFVWYGKATGLTNIGKEVPEGTFSFAPAQPEQQFTLTEMTDRINDALLARKWLLIRWEQTFTVVSADEKLDAKFYTHLELDDLAKRGRTELVTVHVPLAPAVGPEIEAAVSKMNGPFGRAGWYPPANTLILRDTVENVRSIVKTVRALEDAAKRTKPAEM